MKTEAKATLVWNRETPEAVLDVHGGFAVKEALKERGYHYEPGTKAWRRGFHLDFHGPDQFTYSSMRTVLLELQELELAGLILPFSEDTVTTRYFAGLNRPQLRAAPEPVLNRAAVTRVANYYCGVMRKGPPPVEEWIGKLEALAAEAIRKKVYEMYPPRSGNGTDSQG